MHAELSTKFEGSATIHAGIGKQVQVSEIANTVHILALCWVHSVIGWGFFILQSWIPTYLTQLGVTDLRTVGLLSALPWVVRHICLNAHYAYITSTQFWQSSTCIWVSVLYSCACVQVHLCMECF